MATFNIYCASYHRPENKVQDLLEYVTYVVRKSEEPLYRKCGKKQIWGIEDEKINSFVKVHNYIIENAPEDVVAVVDDDMEWFKYSMEHGVRIKDPEITTRELERLCQVVYDLDIGLLGSRITGDPKQYRAPFRFAGMIGPIRIYNRAKLKSRYNEMKFFSDTDYVLQELLNNRIILREDYFCAEAKIETNKGGMNDQRNRKIQLELAEYMKHKWGKYFAYSKENNVSKILVKR